MTQKRRILYMRKYGYGLSPKLSIFFNVELYRVKPRVNPNCRIAQLNSRQRMGSSTNPSCRAIVVHAPSRCISTGAWNPKDVGACWRGAGAANGRIFSAISGRPRAPATVARLAEGKRKWFVGGSQPPNSGPHGSAPLQLFFPGRLHASCWNGC